MDKINVTYVELLNGILIIKHDISKTFSCEFVDEKDTFKMSCLKSIKINKKWNVKFFDFEKIIKNNITRSKVPMEQDIIYKSMKKFESKLSTIFGNKSCLFLFLYYLVDLLINEKNQLIVFDDKQNIVPSLIMLLVPDYFENEAHVCDRMFLFENESWKHDEQLNLLYSNNLFDKTNAKIIGFNSVIENNTCDNLNIIKVNSNEDLNLETNQNNCYFNSCIMLYMIVDIINKTKNLPEIKPLYNKWLSQYLEYVKGRNKINVNCEINQ